MAPAPPKSPTRNQGTIKQITTRSVSRSRERAASTMSGHYDNMPLNQSQLVPSPSARATPTARRRGRPSKKVEANNAMGDAVQNFKQAVSEVDSASTVTGTTVSTAATSGSSGQISRSDQSMLGVIRDSAASIQEQSIQSIQEESSQIQTPPSPNLDQQQQTELPKTELPPKRPAFKAKLNNYLRNSISLFKKSSKNPAVTQILTMEDAGLDDQTNAIGFQVPGSNTVILNEPVKVRLARIANVLGFTSFGVFLHCIIFMVSFITINFLTTFYFPVDDEEKISYFHSLMTRDNEINTLLGHYELNKEVWLRWPQMHPELLAICATVVVSAVIAKVKGRKGDQNEGARVPLVNLY